MRPSGSASFRTVYRAALLEIRGRFLGGLLALLSAGTIRAATFDVGPDPHATPTDVPWESLNAGDTVRIHWRPAAYRDKWVICRQGTANPPIVVRGVLDRMANCPSSTAMARPRVQP